VQSAEGLVTVRNGHSATLLADGRILIAGGSTEIADTGSVATAEIWDPVAGTITPTGSLRSDRMFHASTLLSDGRVLIVGGFSSAPGPATRKPVNSSEIWDPGTGEFTVVASLRGIGGETGAMSTSRNTGNLALVTLPDGRVLILDGSTAWTWDPVTDALEEAGPFLQPRTAYAVALLPLGRALVVGGLADSAVLATAEVWDPVRRTFAAAGSLRTARSNATATTLLDGRVLVVGGFFSIPESVVGSAELWEPGTSQ
jgi:hypothetical protein